MKRDDMPDAVTRLPLPFLLERRDDIQLGSTVGGKTLEFEKCLVKAKQAAVCHSALLEEFSPNGVLFGGVIHLAREPRRC